MKYINKRESFINNLKKNKNSVNESFDMSGGSGPMGNDINWGDSLVGRLFNSIFRKIGIAQDVRSINNVIKKIQKEFDNLIIQSKLDSSDIDNSTLSRIHISYLLEALTKAVHSGTQIFILKALTEETIDIVEESELKSEDKDQAIKELEDFLKFLEGFEDDKLGEPLSDELTGIDSSEEENTSTNESGGWGNNIQSGMIRMIQKLVKVIELKDKSLTLAQGEKEEVGKSKDKNYIRNKIIESLKNVYNTPLLGMFVTVKENSIYFRDQKLATVDEKGQFIGNIGKWDSQNKRFTKDEKPRIMKITNEVISAFSSHIASRLKETLGDKAIDKDVQLKDNEVKWFNDNITSQWAYMKSNSGNSYSVQIANIDNTGQFKNDSIYKVKNDKVVKIPTSYGPTKISSLFKRSTLFKKQGECFKKLKEESKKVKEIEPAISGLPTTGVYKNQKVKVLDIDGDKAKIELESGKVIIVNKIELSINESYLYDIILEKTVLSKEETHAEQALSRLKNSINLLVGGENKKPALTIDFLKSIETKGSKDFMKKFASEIKSKYNQISEKIQSKPLYENIQLIDDSLVDGLKEKGQAKSLRASSAEKIATFASVSMLFIGEGLYGELGELGKALDNFNSDFQKLLNTEFSEPQVENRLFKYSGFIKINEKKVQDEIKQEIITYYEANVNYKKWVVTKEEVESVDKKIENTNPTKLGHESIIEIVKLFNKAHKIHTTDVIPSGRKNGKVSNRVFREYEFVGDGSNSARPAADGGIEPGIGPYRNKKVFNKFEEAILNIIKDSKYKEIFTENVKIVTNIRNRDGKDVSNEENGSGKILLKFITDLLDGNKLYKQGAQSKFLQEYFGFKLDDRGSGYTGDESKKTTKETKTSNKLGKLEFKRVDEIELNERSIYASGTSKDDNIYLFIIEKVEGKVYIKYTTNFNHIKQYIKNDVFKGDLKEVITNGEELKYGILSEDDFPIKSEVSLKYITADNAKRDIMNLEVLDEKIKVDRGVWTIKSEDGEIFKIPGDDVTYRGNGDISGADYRNYVHEKLKRS